MGVYDHLLEQNTPTPNSTPTPLPKGQVVANNYLPGSSSGLSATDVTPDKLEAYKAHNVDLRENVGQFDEQLHENQSTTDRLGNMVGNLALKTVAYVGQSAGFILGAPAALVGNDMTNMTDNWLVKASEGLKDYATEAMPIYKGNTYSNGGIFDKIGTSDWWLDDATDRLALTLSMFVPGTLVAKGFGIVGGLGKILGAANDVEKGVAELSTLDATAQEIAQSGKSILTDLPSSKFESLGRAINQSFTSAKAGEAVEGVSAKLLQQAKNMTKAELMVQNTIGQSALGARESQIAVKKDLEEARARGENNYSDEEIQSKAVDAAKGVFFENIPAALMMSAVELPQMFSTFNGTKHLWEKAFDAELNPIVQVADSFGKKALKTVGKALGTGLEHGQGENLQVAIGKYNEDRAEGKTSDGVFQGIASDFIKDFSDPNGQNNIALGTIQGILTSVLGGAARANRIRTGKEVSETQHIKNLQDLVSAAKLNYASDTNFTKKDATGKTITEDGKPVRDTEKIKNAIIGLVGSVKNATDTQFAAGDNDEVAVRMLKHQALAKLTAQFVNQPGGIKYLNALLKIQSEEAKNDTDRIPDHDHLGNEITPEMELQDHLETVKHLEKVNDLINRKTFKIDSTGFTPEQKVGLATALQFHKQAIFDNASQQYFHEKELRKNLDELTYNNVEVNPLTNEATLSEEKMKGLTADRINELVKQSKVHKEEIKRLGEVYSEVLTNKDVVKGAMNVIVEKHQAEVKKQQEVIDSQNKEVDTKNAEVGNKVDRIKEIDAQLDEIDNQLMTAGDQATPEELKSINENRQALEDEKAGLINEQQGKTRDSNISHINQHSLKNGESALYKGDKVVINELDPNTGLATINTGKEILSVPIKDLTKIILATGDINETTSATMTEDSKTDINSAQTATTEDTLTLNTQEKGGRSNVVMNKQFKSKLVGKVFKWVRNKLGFPEVESNINNIDHSFVNSPTSLLPGSTIEYKIVEPNEEQKKVFKTGEQAIGIYQNDKLVGFVASPKEVDQTNPDKDFIKRANAERASLVTQRSHILEKLNNKESVTSTVSDKGAGNYIARIMEDGKGVFVDGDGKVISLMDREFRPEDLIGGNPVFVVVRNGSLSVPEIQESDKLSKTQKKEAISKLNSDIADLQKNGNRYSKVEGQVFMLVKAANGKWSPVPVYSTYHTEETADKILKIIDDNVVETEDKKLVAALNPLLYTGFEDTRTIRIFQTTKDGIPFLNIDIDGTKYSLDEIKNNPVQREKFKSALLKTRQNIFANSLNTADGQATIKENRSITTNVNVQDDGNYFVQPYIEYKSPLAQETIERINNDAPVVEEVKPTQETITEEKKPVNPKDPFANYSAADNAENAEEQSADDKWGQVDTSTEFDINDEAPRVKTKKEVAAEVENIKQIKAWFKKNLPQIPHQILDELFKLDGTRAGSWGIFQNNIAKVIKDAPKGTSYHEAFHGVFRILLTDKEQLEIMKEAVDKYGIPTIEQLKELNKFYKGNLDNEQATWLFYEEKLAEDHGKYADSFEPQGFFGKIGEFFKKIAQFFGLFQDAPKSKIDGLFKSINTGKFAKRIPQVSDINRTISKLYDKDAYRAIVDANGKQLFTAAYKTQRVRNLANKFQAEFTRIQSSGVDSNKISANKIFDNIYNDYVALRDKLMKELEPTAKNKNIINKLRLFTDQDIFNQFRREAIKNLANMKINVKEKVEFKEQDNSISEEDDAVDDYAEIPSITGNVTKGLVDRVHIAGLSSASTRLKMFVSSVPVKYANGKTKVDDFGDVVYHDFNEMYYYLERNLIGLNNLEDQLEELNLLSSSRPELKTIIERLTDRQVNQSPEDFQRLKDDFTSNFSKQHLGYTLVMSEVDNASGAVNFSIIDANRNTVAREVFNDWNNNLLKAEKNTISEIKDGLVKVNGTVKAKKAYADWMELIKDKDNMTFDNVNKMLLKIGIEYSPDALEEILKENSADFLNAASRMFQYYASETPEEIKGQAMKDQMSLVNYETKYMLNRYSLSFQNGEKKNIWSIQLPSFMSKLVAKLTNTNVSVVKAEIAKLRQDKSNTYSNLLNKLAKDELFRKNFKVNYLDSLKDKKGTGLGVTFTNMNGKDYLAMSIALFHNKAVNGNRVSTEDINKYIYITPSDKSMVAIIDSNSYGVTINPSGKLNKSSEIVEKYYNTVKSEIQRIYDQLKVEEKVKSGELTKEKLKLHYHYTKGNKTIESTDPSKIVLDGFAYQFNEFTSLNKGTKEKSSVLDALKDAFKGGADYSEVENVFKEEIMQHIMDELDKELAQSIIEAVDKNIISVDPETGLLENQSLDWGSKSMQKPLELSHRIRQTLGDFALNQRLAYMEFSNLFNGDIAQYKANDLQKRSYQSQAMGVNVVASADEVVKTMLVKDVEIESDFLNSIDKDGKSKEWSGIYNSWIETLESLGYSKSKAERMLGKYEKTNVTDATVFGHPTLFKKLCKRIWTDQLEEAYNIAEEITKNPTKKQIEQSIRVLNGLKPFAYGSRFDKDLGVMIHEQVKTFIVPAFKSLIKGNSLLEKQRKYMDKSGVEMLAVESAFKASIGYRFDINELTQDHYDNHSFELPLENMSIQVDNPNHSFEEENDSLRQLKMIMVGAIDQNKTYGGKSGREILSVIDSMESANVNQDIAELMKHMNSLDDTFKKDVQDGLTTRTSTENMEKMLEIVNGEWTHPLNSGTHEIPAQNMMSAMITNNAIKQPFKGGNLVNTTSLGVDSGKFLKQSEIDKNPYLKGLQSKLEHLRENKATGQIEHAQCILPAYMEAFYNEDGTIKDVKNIPENLKELILYRIPTEFLHSMLPAKAVGFFPKEMGNFILLPYDITTQMGLDFDFDKLFFMRPEYTTDDAGNHTKVAYNSSISVEENTREARNNRIFDSYMQFLRAKENFDKIIAPSDFFELQKLKSDISKEPTNKVNEKKSFFSGITQRELKERNHIGLALKAMTSLEVTGHSYSTKMQLSIDKKFKMKFNDVDGKDLSQIDNKDGQNIAQLLYKVQAAVMDDVKDPILDTLGINKNTIATFSAIVRAGYGLQTAVNLITQPAIIELSKKLDSNNEKTKVQGAGRITIDSLTQLYVNKYNNVKSQLDQDRQDALTEQEEYFIGKNPTHNLLDEAKKPGEIDQRKWGMKEWRQFAKKVNVNDLSKENITANPKMADYYLYQAKVLFNYGRYDKVGTALSKVNRFFALNTKIGPNVENINDQIYNRDEILSEDFPIKNVAGFKNLKALDSYNEVLNKAYEFFKKEFPYATDPFNNLKTQIVMSQLDYNNPVINKISQDKRMIINGFISSYIDRQLPAFQNLVNNAEQKRLMVEFTKHISNIKSLKNEQYAKLRKSLFIDQLRVTWGVNGEDGAKFMSLKGNKLDNNIKDNITEDFYSLYTNPETRQLAIDFVKYSVIASGLYRGINSYHDLIPAEILTDIEFSTHRKQMNSDLNNNPANVLSNTDIKRLKDLIIRNFAGEFTRVSNSSAFNIDRTNNTLTTNYNKVVENNQSYAVITARPSDEASEQYAEYIRVFMQDVNKVELYHNISEPGTAEQIYQRISFLGQKAKFIEMSVNENNESLIAGNNYDYTVEQADGEVQYDPSVHDVNYNGAEESTEEGENQSYDDKATEDIPKPDENLWPSDTKGTYYEQEFDQAKESFDQTTKSNSFANVQVTDEDASAVQGENDVNELCD